MVDYGKKSYEEIKDGMDSDNCSIKAALKNLD